MAKNVLLLTAETYSKYIHPEDKGNISIFGNAASATIVSTEGFAKIGEFAFGTDGSGADELIVKTGGARNTDKLNEISHNSENDIIKTAQKILYNAQNFDTKFSGLENLKKVHFNAIIELKETK